MAIIGRPTLLVSPDSSTGLENIVSEYCSTLGSNCNRKKESEIKKEDISGDIFLVGILSDFKQWERYRLSVSKKGKGFFVNGTLFNDALDGFVLIDSNRIVIAGNSLQAVKDAQLALTGGHDLLITQKGKITFFGNKKEHGFNWFNLQTLKTTNYTEKKSTLFSAIYISKTFADTIDQVSINKDVQKYATQFLSIYQINMPVKKSSWFIHSNMQEYGTMSGMFGLTCPGNNSAGFSIRGEIHTNGFNMGLLKHEYSHMLFDNSIPQDHNPAFFVEGCVEYVTNLNDKVLLSQRIAIAKQYRDSLPYADLILHNKDFYGQYSSANYSICGIFVQYLVEQFKVEAFKQYCLAADKEAATKLIFKQSFGEIVEGYKRWLDKQ
jgi:hypothetical protein